MLNTTHAIRTKFSRNESHSVGFNNQPHITHYSYMKGLFLLWNDSSFYVYY